MEVQRAGPFGRTIAPTQHVLPVEQVNPVIRIAHRRHSVLNIAERIIVDHELVLIVAGNGLLRTRDAETPFKPGTLLFIRPFVPHAFESTGNVGEHLAIHFDFRANVPPRGRDLDQRSPYRVVLSGGLDLPAAHQCSPGDVVYDAIMNLVDAGPVDAPLVNVAQRGHLLRVLATLLKVPQSPNNGVADDLAAADQHNMARVNRAIQQMSTKLASPWDAASLAAVAGLSPSHFTRLFRRRTGYTPMTYLRRRRIDAARALLADVDLSIKEIAARCGFDDPYHFSKVFHQIDGLSPSVYRETVLAGRGSVQRREGAKAQRNREVER